MDTVERIWALCEPAVGDLGMELVDVECPRGGGGSVLRLYVDREGGVSVADCARVSREVGYLLDAEDVMRGRYFLEVSSPGIDRVLRKKEHFQKFKGQPLRVVLKEPMQGSRKIHGRIEDCSETSLFVMTESGDVLEIPLSSIDKANLRGEIPFGAGGSSKKRGKTR